MELYNILLVDDEADVLQAMKKKIDWEAMGFCLAGTAENGQEALEMAEQLHIDVVMTDIKMPYMDGLTLCKKLKENYRNMKVVIYSGFDDFEFAREAVHLEAEEYLLKPISSKDMEKVLTKIRKKLDEEFDEHRNMNKLYEYYQKSLPAMQEQLFMSILEGKVTGDRAKAMLDTYEMKLDAPCYAVAVLYTEAMNRDIQEKAIPIRAGQLLTLSLKDIAQDYLNGRMKFYSVIYLEEVIILFMLDKKEDMDTVLYHLDQVCKMGSRVLKASVTAAVGQPCDSLDSLTTSYQEAGNAMEYRTIMGMNQVLYIRDIEPSPKDSVSFMEYDFQNLVRAVKLGDRDETDAAIKQFIENIKGFSLTPNQYQLICMELSTELMKIGRSYKLRTKQIFGEGNHIPWQEIYKHLSVDELESWLQEICTNLRHTLRHERTDSTLKLTEQAKAYIEEHYKENDLSAETLCRYLNVSAAYFSTIFKKEVGLSFVAYLTKIRLEHAVELLRTTEDKTYVIANEVGYTEPNYFSYVFKKQYGISPSKYRANLLAQDKGKENQENG
ncbi:response regulator [Ruminococcus sp. 5_1_39BFAA]|uniref:response regulator n=1 Tax=Ruminococcus sp. 5_1_39BFAA TaxID=457412 RepID=UPI0035657CF4